MERLDIILIRDLIYADIDFWSIVENEYHTMSVLVDTGARITTLSHSALKRLGYSLGGLTNVRTAGGKTQAHEVIIPKIKIGSIEMENIDAHSNNFLDKFKMDGILGMNILNKFNFSVNFKTKIMTLDNY